MIKANKIKMLFIVISTLLALTSNVNAVNFNDKSQDNLEQLKELITSRLDFVHRLSSKGVESKLLISELTTLRLLQDAYIQMLVDNNNHKNGSIQLKKPIIKTKVLTFETEDVSKKISGKEVSLGYRKQYVKGLGTLGITLTKSEGNILKTIKTQKEFLKFHKTILFKYKKAALVLPKPLANIEKKTETNNSLSTCSVF